MFQEKMEIPNGKVSGLKCVTFHSKSSKNQEREHFVSQRGTKDEETRRKEPFVHSAPICTLLFIRKNIILPPPLESSRI